VGGDVTVDNESLLMTDFVNLKIKLTQSFGGAHRGRVCVRVFIGVSAHMCMSIRVCIVSQKKVRLWFPSLTSRLVETQQRVVHMAPSRRMY
jgi:hypothetical protein